jgi:membrane protease YdiL (CAAX protease family)
MAGGRVAVASTAIRRDHDHWFTAIASAIGLAIGAYAAGNVIAALAIFLLQSAGIAVLGYSGRTAVVSAIALQAIGFGGVAFMYVEYTQHGQELVRAHVPNLREVGYFIGGIVAVFLGLFATTYFITLIGIQPAENAIIKGIRNPQLLLVLIPVSLIIVGPAEELLFRGLVQGRIKRAIGPVGAIIIASAVFASIHASGLLGSPKQLIASLSVIFVLALILGSLYERTGNLVIPATVHGLFNSIQFFLAYLIAVGQLPGTG